MPGTGCGSGSVDDSVIVQVLPTGILFTITGPVDDALIEKVMVGPPGTLQDTVTGNNAPAGNTSLELLVIDFLTVRLLVFNTGVQISLFSPSVFVLLLYQSVVGNTGPVEMPAKPRLQVWLGVKGPATWNDNVIVQPAGKLEMRNRD
jgi:hypothetical protein